MGNRCLWRIGEAEVVNVRGGNSCKAAPPSRRDDRAVGTAGGVPRLTGASSPETSDGEKHGKQSFICKTGMSNLGKACRILKSVLRRTDEKLPHDAK